MKLVPHPQHFHIWRRVAPGELGARHPWRICVHGDDHGVGGREPFGTVRLFTGGVEIVERYLSFNDEDWANEAARFMSQCDRVEHRLTSCDRIECYPNTENVDGPSGAEQPCVRCGQATRGVVCSDCRTH